MVFPPRHSGMFGPMNPFQRPGNIPMPQQASGNGISSIFKSIFGGGNTGFSQAAGMPFSTMAQTGAGGGGFAGSLQNIQQILKMVETTAPVIKQYGPMVKNLPAMLKMMKALNSMESESEESSSETAADDGDKTDEEQMETESEKLSETDDSAKPAKPKKRTGESVPLLYI